MVQICISLYITFVYIGLCFVFVVIVLFFSFCMSTLQLFSLSLLYILRSGNDPWLFFLYKLCCLLCFQISYFYLQFYDECHRNLTWISLSMQTAFVSIASLRVWALPVHKHVVSCYHLMSSSSNWFQYFNFLLIVVTGLPGLHSESMTEKQNRKRSCITLVSVTPVRTFCFLLISPVSSSFFLHLPLWMGISPPGFFLRNSAIGVYKG